jgi:AICAR transformylase/IMP cyclohydrolase PurH
MHLSTAISGLLSFAANTKRTAQKTISVQWLKVLTNLKEIQNGRLKTVESAIALY